MDGSIHLCLCLKLFCNCVYLNERTLYINVCFCVMVHVNVHVFLSFCASGGHVYCTVASLDFHSILSVRSAAVGGHESTLRSFHGAAEEGYLQWKVRGAHHYPAPRVSFLQITIWISLLECTTAAWSINMDTEAPIGELPQMHYMAYCGSVVKITVLTLCLWLSLVTTGKWKYNIYASSAQQDQITMQIL